MQTWFRSATTRTRVLRKIGAIQGAFYLLGETTAASIPELPAEAPARQLQQILRLTRSTRRLQYLTDEIVGQRVAFRVHKFSNLTVLIKSYS